MNLDLTDEETAALLAELDRIIRDDRYPLSPRIRMLRAIRATQINDGCWLDARLRALSASLLHTKAPPLVLPYQRSPL